MRAADAVCRVLPLLLFGCGIAGAASAQTLPVQACRGAIPCGDHESHRGFGDQYLKQGDSNAFLVTEASFGQGFELRFVTGAKAKAPAGAVVEAVRVFVARHPFLLRSAPLYPPASLAPPAPLSPPDPDEHAPGTPGMPPNRSPKSS